MKLLTFLDDIMYFPILVVIMAAAGILFTVRTRFVQIRKMRESCRLIMEKPADKAHVSSFQALMVSTASRVGTGNIIGVSTAICLGGPGAVFWMWIMCIIGASSAFMESTLAQIFKQRDDDGGCYGGPAYYIQRAVKGHRWLSILFCIFLLATYGFGFNMLCSYNLQSSFAGYSFYHEKWTPVVIGAILALLVGYCLYGGGNRIVKITEYIVPIMGIFYVLISLIVIIVHITSIPHMFVMIFEDAFDFKSIFGGISGSCMIYGIKRGLYSNEAGVGSAPNASASATVSHPVKQGLVQTISVYIDTMILCTATALMCLCSGAERSAATSGAPYVQAALSSVFKQAGPIFITVALAMFAFTTLLGNLYYTDNALAYINHRKKPSTAFMHFFYLLCIIAIFFGASMEMDAAWAVADISMGGMTLINLPCCLILSNFVIKALNDYEKQKKVGKNPTFDASSIGIPDDEENYWRE